MNKEKEISENNQNKKSSLIIGQLNDFSEIDKKVRNIAEKFKKTMTKKKSKSKVEKAAKSGPIH